MEENMDEVTFYIVRHGKTMMNTLLRSQGWCDSPLTPLGIEVAEFLGRGLQDIHFDAAYCSTLRRTLQTAEIVLREKGQRDLPIIEEDGFKEAGLGSYEAHDEFALWLNVALYLQYTTIEEMDKDLDRGKLHYRDMNNTIAKIDNWNMAEDWKTIETRTQQALSKIAEIESQRGSKNVLIVSHSMAIAAMLLSLGGEGLIKGGIQNASVCKVTYSNNKFMVLSMGDMSYVEKGKQLAK